MTALRGIDLWPVWLILLLLSLGVMWRRKRNASYLVLFSIFWFYLVVLVSVVVFPLDIDNRLSLSEILNASRLQWLSIRLLPYTDVPDPSRLAIHIVENIMLTVPFGFGLRFIVAFRPSSLVRIALVVGLTTEGAQLIVTLLGYKSRSVDIYDIAANAFGVLIGYGIFKGSTQFYIRMSSHFGIPRKGILAYVDDVANSTRES